MEGKANAHLLTFLGKAFGVAKSLVSLESGELNRQKPARGRPSGVLTSNGDLQIDGLGLPGVQNSVNCCASEGAARDAAETERARAPSAYLRLFLLLMRLRSL